MEKQNSDCKRVSNGVERTFGRRERKRKGDDFSLLKVTDRKTGRNGHPFK